LKLSIPVEYGGEGADWQEIYQVIRVIARADSSIAQVLAFQYLMLASIRLYATPEQWQFHYKETATKNLWWGNALNPLDERTFAVAGEQGFVISGKKGFCSGAVDSDRLIISAIEQETGRFLVAAVPTEREGIQLNHDWDNMGQRQTDSGGAEFNELRITQDEVLDNPGPLSSAFSSLRSLIAQLIFTNIYLGIAEGALEEARGYTLQNSRVWSASLAEETSNDPYTLLHYGEFWTQLNGARIQADHAAQLLEKAWEKDLSLTDAERGELALAIFSTKANITKAGLDVTSRIFEVTGARATTAKLRLDRFWRNIRVYTLHDPVDYKLQDLGNWALNHVYPTPSFYS
jgi:alkylation response protein AidB-like acyl-CoA dehydrogenase